MVVIAIKIEIRVNIEANYMLTQIIHICRKEAVFSKTKIYS